MRPAPIFTSAFVASAAASALTGVASAQALFTTLNSATVSLSSLNGSSVSSSSTYTGPANNLFFTPMPAMSVPGTGTSDVSIFSSSPDDTFRMEWFAPSAATYTIQMTWDVTFNSSLGGVEFSFTSIIAGTETLTVTPLGGSSSNLTVGDYLANGRYTFQWDFTETSATTGVAKSLFFKESGGTAVPLPGAAGLAAVGLAGLSRRRRR
jgi:MYXO-CTERM domain-containing protein